MKKILLLISLLIIMLFAGNASAVGFFRIIEVSPIHVAPNSETNFTATVKGLGPDGGYVQLIFRNVTPGISVNFTEGYKYVLSTGTRKFNCTAKAGNIAPGNYSFEMGIYAQDAKVNWRTAYVVVEPISFIETAPVLINMPNDNGSANMTNVQVPMVNKTAAASVQQKTPAFGISAAIIILILASRRRGRDR